MKPKLFDTHAHLDDPRFDEDRPDVLARMEEAGVALCVAVGADMPTSLAALELARRHPQIYCALGVHPHDAKNMAEEDYITIGEGLKDPKAIAWGEIGLDYHYDYSPRDIQRSVFERQLVEATRLGVPVILHIREAHPDMLAILRAQPKLPRCVAHCFSGSWEVAKQYLDLGLYLSFAGPLTFKNAAKLPEVAKKAPIDRILVETDSPYLSPEPLRGRRNEPTNVVYVARKLAEYREMDENSLMLHCWENALAFYGLDG